jgi:hypothetical protein
MSYTPPVGVVNFSLGGAVSGGPPSGAYHVSGIVRENGVPVARTVFLLNNTTKDVYASVESSAVDGSYQFSSIASGQYSLWCYSPVMGRVIALENVVAEI